MNHLKGMVGKVKMDGDGFMSVILYVNIVTCLVLLGFRRVYQRKQTDLFTDLYENPAKTLEECTT